MARRFCAVLSSALLAAILLAASPEALQSSTQDEDSIARAEFGRIYFFFLDVDEEGGQAGLYRRVARQFRRHLEKYPDGEMADHARLHLGECLLRVGEEEEAVKVWEEISGASDKSLFTEARIRLANYRFARREYEKALPDFQTVAEETQEEYEVGLCRLREAFCLYFLGERADAREALAKIVREDPEGTAHEAAEYYLNCLPENPEGRTAEQAIRDYYRVYSAIRRGMSQDGKRILEDLVRENLQAWDGLEDPKVLQILKAIVHTRDHSFAGEAMRELRQIGTPEALGPLRLTLQGQNNFHRTALLYSLVAGRVFVQDAFVEKIFYDRTITSVALREAAAHYIAMRDSAKAVSKLYGGIRIPEPDEEDFRDLAVNEGIRRALGEMRSKEAAKALGRIARDTGRPLLYREYAIEALSRMAHPEVLRELKALLHDDLNEIVKLAVEALGQTADPGGADALLRLLKKKPNDPGLLMSLLRALEHIGVRETDEEVYVSISKSNNADVRILAHALLRQTWGPAARKRLAAALRDRLWQVRWHAIRAQGQGEPSVESVSTLIARLPKESDRLKPEILRYLQRMTGLNLGPDAKEWETWWKWARETYDPNDIDLATRVLGDRPGRTVSRSGVDGKYFGLDVGSGRVIFILDISASMAMPITVPPLGGESTKPRRDTKINIAKQELTRVLRKFKRKRAFNCFWFGSEWSSLWDGLRPAVKDNVSQAILKIRSLQTMGSTNIYDPLAVAVKDPQVDTIYLLSDGEPNTGEFTTKEAILLEIAKLNQTRRVTIHTIYLGGTSGFMRQLAADNGGQYVPVAR